MKKSVRAPLTAVLSGVMLAVGPSLIVAMPGPAFAQSEPDPLIF